MANDEQDFYAPPSAPLEDADRRFRLRVARPRAVTYGVVALYVPLGLAIAMLLLNVLGLGNMATPPSAPIAAGLFAWLALLVAFVWQAGRGRRWARIAVAIVTALTILSAVNSFSAIKHPPTIRFLSSQLRRH
jgi:hypothetical protein